ncbi:hypothetical protein IAG44_21940 [Streptomyces roseirectus]|uniref:Uncharacterized protein n=1 Tax=Streptomyces roseirectus TaxID=2768066 RepID=A0A7H0IG98_9ACTN|nr:hypothetical protein [Streptomyces roseirectus]QNP71814.1 hypothetical protein IAG44_21940 [Streptomyces roseirectus]
MRVKAEELPISRTRPLPWLYLLSSEFHRLAAPRAARLTAALLPVAVLLFGLSKLLLHDGDTSAAWRTADERFTRFQEDAARYDLPTNAAITPRFFYDDPRYLMEPLAYGDLRTLVTALAAAAVLFGIFAGGSDWASRIMLTLAAAEPRRGRLFGTRALLVTGLSMAATAVAGALVVPLLLLAAWTTNGLSGLDGTFWNVLAGIYVRGVLLVGVLALLGYSLAMLTRRTSTALAVAFLYLASADRLFAGRGPRLAEYDMGGLVHAVLNERPVIPLARSECFAGPGCEAVHVDLTIVDGLLGVLIYLVPILALALWRSTRTDIG